MVVVRSARKGITRSQSRACDSAGVSAWARHGTNNPLSALVKLHTGGRKVVLRRRGQAIRAQPGAEFGIGATEAVDRDFTAVAVALAPAARLVFGEQIGPLGSWLPQPIHHHPDDSGMGRWLSRHHQARCGQEVGSPCDNTSFSRIARSGRLVNALF
jgi:hypothetical protein